MGGPWSRAYATFIPYQLFIVAGAIAADHREQLAAMVRGRGRWLAVALVGTGALAIGSYFHRVLDNGAPTNDPNSAFEPTVLPFVMVAVVSIYAMGLHWSTHYREGSPRLATAVSYAANRSFPVFLVHVMVMFWILRATTDSGQPVILAHVPQPFGTIVVYLLVVAGSLAVTEILRRLPGSLYLTGRPRLPLRFMI
ncbi:acyltransferase family protein [Gordonia humi]|uniref:acyltransferase family protein n=1 Tax=Gordonia humi TaxID=686429 RepID=UPI003614566C